MVRYLRSAPKTGRSRLATPPRRPSRSKTARRLFLESLEDRSLLAGLNSVIDGLLVGFAPEAPPSPSQEFTFTNVTVGTSVGGGTADLELQGVSLSFSDLAYVSGSWTGTVAVTAEAGVLFPGLLDIAVEDGDDVDAFGVVGNINLALGDNTSRLALDDIDAEEIGVPAFLDLQFTSLGLDFADFRGNDNSSTLEADIEFLGLDTGVAELNELMASDNPLFQLALEGSASTSLDLAAIESAAAAQTDIVAAFQEELAAEVGSDLQEGVALNVVGKIFHVGDIAGKASYHTLSIDPDGAGPQPEQTSGYIAVQGSFRIANEELGGRGPKFELAFAISDLGPLQFYISKSPTESPPDEVIPPGSIIVEAVSFGVIFNKTIEQLQSGIDYFATAATTPVAAGGQYRTTLTIDGHDLETGDEFAIVEANGAPSYVGEYTVESVAGDKVTLLMDTNPGPFAGSASIIRRTIKDPLDLRDDGLRTGISIPGSIEDWNNQLDASVRELLVAGDDHWAQMFEDMVIGGGAMLSVSDIPDTVLMMDVNMYLDTHLRAMAQGNLILADGVVQVPASLYGDLSNLVDGSGGFLFLADVGQIPLVDDPLLVVRGEASFAVIEDGFQIALAGGVDLNIPEATTITLEGEATLGFLTPATGTAELQIDLGFDADLSEENIGDIAAAKGDFHVAIDVPTPDPDDAQQGTAEIWGAAILTTEFDFLDDAGLDVTASAVLRVNSSDNDKQPEVLEDSAGNEVQVALPKESFALRFDGFADLSIDGGSVARLGGIFVLEFSTAGFNVALFDEVNGQVVPASIAIGPASSRLLEFGALGFLAIRNDGIAADLVLTADANLPLNLAHLDADAVFIVNTTGDAVTFHIPGGLDPRRSTGLSVTIPAAAPSSPEAVLADGLDKLITGSPSWSAGTAGPYGVVFLAGEMDLLTVLTVDVSGYFLLSEDLVTLKASFSAEGDFLNLAQAEAHGTLFYNSQGEFLMDVGAGVQLGPDWINIHGSADLAISYLDSDLLGSQGDRNPKLAVTGDLDVGLTIDIDPFPAVDLDINLLTVGYKSGEITVSVDYPEPYWAEECVDTVIFGVVCIPYPSVRMSPYTFSIGTLTATAEPPPPPVLGQVDASGVLTLNVGPNALARKLLVDQPNEDVVIESLSAGSITVSMFGYSQKFDNVARISIADMAAGNDVVEIKSTVGIPVEVHLGAGDDRLRNAGSSVVTAYGDAGNDFLDGGSANDRLFGGTGKDTIDGKAGQDWIEGGDDGDKLVGGDGADTIKGGAGGDLIAGDLAEITTVFADPEKTRLSSTVFATKASASGGNDTIEGGDDADIVFAGSGGDSITGNLGIDRVFGGDGKVTFATTVTVEGTDLGLDGNDSFFWNVGDGADLVDGQAGSDTLEIRGTDGSAEQVTVSAKGAGLTADVGPESLSADRVEIANIEGRAGGDTFAINDLTGSVLQQLNLKLGADSVQDTVLINGSGGADVYNITTPDTNTLQVGVSGGVTINVRETSGTSGGDTITLDAKAGADTVHVRGTLTATLTTVKGGDGADRIHVGNSGSLNGIVGKLVVEGGLDSDTLELDDTTDIAANTGTLTATQVTGLGLGGEGLAYAEVETLNVSLGSGGDAFGVQDTAAGTASVIRTGGGSDKVTVSQTSLGGPISLDGQAEGDTFDIHLGSLAAAVSVADSGVSGSDALNILGIAGVNQIVLEFARLTRAADVVNYSGVEALNIDTHDSPDSFTILDNGNATIINSGKGDDEFVIGPAVNEDGEVIDANHSGSNSDELLIKGTSFDMTINARDDNDDFEINRNTGELFLNGQNGNDVFVLNTLITGGDSNVDGGSDTDLIVYLQNAPVHINGGDGFDKIIVNGSKLHDVFIIRGTTLEVVGSRLVEYIGIESLEANGRRGNDTFQINTNIDRAGSPVTTTQLQILAVNGQQDSDTVYLTPSDLGTEIFIRGGDPQAPLLRSQLPGDALYLDFAGLTAAERQGVRLNATGLNDPVDPVFNTWNIPEHAPVHYKQIEKMNHVQTLAMAADVGSSEPRVKVIDAETGLLKHSFLAFDAGFKGGVRVAVGDVNGDAIPDIIVAAGNGGGPRVRVFNGATGVRFAEPIGEFFAFAAGSKTTVQVAVGDVNLDGLADIITGSDSGGQPLVKVFDAHKLLTGQANPVMSQFLAYDRNFTGGVRLAVGDLNGDGVLDIATGPGSGLNAQVRIFKTNLSADQILVSHSLLTSFSAFPKYNGGVNVAVGDVTGDGRADLVAGSAAGGTAMVRIYNGATVAAGKAPTLMTDFKPFGTQSGGVRAALVDFDGDGVNELIVASALTGSKVKPKAFDLIPNSRGGLTPAAIDAFFAAYAADPFFQGPLFLSGKN